MKIYKLPQARLYLEAAQWGIDELITRKHLGVPFRFFMIGILASLRAVQHALKNHDRTFSAAHREAIDEWWNDPKTIAAPELSFIKISRDLILKEGSFEFMQRILSRAPVKDENYTITSEGYDLGFYVNEERRDLHEEIRKAIIWCDTGLASIEAKLPEPETRSD